MSLKNYLPIFLFYLFVACSGKDSEGLAQPAVSDEFKVFQVDINSEPTDLSELIAEVEVVGLEETAASLLDYANRVSVHEDKLVFPSGRKGEIFVYSDQGKYIRKFSRKGDGPGEYSDLKSLWLKEDSILVFNHAKRSLLYYDLEGNHHKTVKFDVPPTHVFTYQDDYMMEMSFEAIEDSLQYRLMTLSQDMTDQEFFIPYQKALPFPVYSNVSSFRPYGEKVAFQPAFHDTVYVADPNGIAPFFKVDFGEDYFWADEALFEKPEAAMGLLGERNQVWIFNTFVGPDQVLINFNTSFNDFFQGIIDRKTGRFHRFDMHRTLEEDFLLIVVDPQADRFLFSLPSTELAELMGKVGAEKVKFRGNWSLEQIESSENPVLLWMKFKKEIG